MNSPQPIPPVNVRLVLYNREIPVECVFTGRTADGIARWVAVSTIDVHDAESAHLLIDELPTATSVTVSVKGSA